MPKAIIIKKNGGPEVLELQDVKIDTPGPDEIKVTNHAIGLNYIDTYHRSGLYPLKLPSGIGLEAAGKVEEVGSNVKEFNIGDKDHEKTSDSNLILLERGNKLAVKATTKSEFLFIAGKPIGEPIARGGPFVMNTKAEILEAIQDYNNGTFAKY